MDFGWIIVVGVIAGTTYVWQRYFDAKHRELKEAIADMKRELEEVKRKLDEPRT